MIPKSEWLQIYVSIKLLKFYTHSSNNGDLKIARSKYQEFLNEQFPNDNEKNNFDSTPNLISFAYMILVRSHELLNRFVEEHQANLYTDIEKKLNLKTDQDFVVRYTMIIMMWENIFDNTGKEFNQHTLEHLVNKIRNSISHFRYTITGGSNILFQDGYNNKKEGFQQNFRVSIPAIQFLQLTLDFSSLMDDYLKDNNLIDWADKK
jgi:hypothetical protein